VEEYKSKTAAWKRSIAAAQAQRKQLKEKKKIRKENKNKVGDLLQVPDGSGQLRVIGEETDSNQEVDISINVEDVPQKDRKKFVAELRRKEKLDKMMNRL
jgi:hypothetical protein